MARPFETLALYGRLTAETVNGRTGWDVRRSNCEFTTSRRAPATATVVGNRKRELVICHWIRPLSQLLVRRIWTTWAAA